MEGEAELFVAEVAADAPLGCTFEWSARGLVVLALDRGANPHLPAALRAGAVLKRFNGEHVTAADATFEVRYLFFSRSRYVEGRIKGVEEYSRCLCANRRLLKVGKGLNVGIDILCN